MFDDSLTRLRQSLGSVLELRAVAETGSTNSDLLDLSRADPQPRLLVAERQTAGRGRQGRSWHAQPGDALCFSLAWPWNGQDLDGLSLAIGSCIADALDPSGVQSSPQISLKWPNDLWWQQRKLGGILIESVSQGGRIAALVIGVGLNLRDPALPGVATAGLHQLDPRWTAPLALETLLPPLLTLLQGWQGFDAAAQTAFERRDGLRGRAVSGGPGEVWRGIAEGVNAQGLLRLRSPDGSLHELRAGEARLLPV